MKYDCNQCDYRATKKSSLTRHIKSVHEGVKYDCNKCDYRATRLDNLTAHIKSIHKGIKYDCNQCDYRATQQGNLTFTSGYHMNNCIKLSDIKMKTSHIIFLRRNRKI